MKHRDILVKKYNHLYKKLYQLDFDKCVYCSDVKQCFDHVPAINLLDSLDIKEVKCILVPSCKKCNTVLSDYPYIDYQSRCEKLIKYYSKKLTSAVWTKKEIAQLDYSLRTKVQDLQKDNLFYQNKIDNLNSNILKNYTEDFLSSSAI